MLNMTCIQTINKKRKMRAIRFAGLSIVLFLNPNWLVSQVKLSEQEAIVLAMKASPMITSSGLQVQKEKQLQGASFNLANPDVTLESPSGEFMTFGVLQSFEFPTVYIKQGQLAKQRTILAEKGTILSQIEVKQRVQSAYLNLQFANAAIAFLKKQDSIYSSISEAASRQFEAGQIDFVSKTYVAMQYGEVHNQYLQALSGLRIAMGQLQLYIGITDSIIPVPLTRNITFTSLLISVPDSNTMTTTPHIQYLLQEQSVAQKSLQVARNKALPGFSFGYLNQGARTTEPSLRLRAGLNIPIWYWQYAATIKAAKTELDISRQTTMLQQQNLALRIQEEIGNFNKYSTSLDYYDSIGLKQADDLISASGRMFSAGESDYIAYLRTMSDAYSIRIKYLEIQKNYNQTIINLHYLIGQ